MRIAVYDAGTGEIRRVVLCPDSTVPMQARAGEDVIEIADDVTDTTHKVADGEVVTL